MFSNNKKSFSSDKIDSLIGKNTSFEGTIRAEGTIRIDGNVEGEVIVSGNIIIGESCTVKGNIQADNAHIAGTIQGNIKADNQLHMTSSSKILGDITVKNVIIDEGAVFIGNCKTTSENSSPSPKKKNTPPKNS